MLKHVLILNIEYQNILTYKNEFKQHSLNEFNLELVCTALVIIRRVKEKALSPTK